MRLRYAAALLAAVLALAVVGLLVANRGAATDTPLADGDATGHYKEPWELGKKAASALQGVVESVPPDGRPHAGTRRGGRTGPLTPSEPLTATEAATSAAVGPLFYTAQGEPVHGCTASVVHSPRRDLIVTAAHCVYMDGFRTDLAFVPGYKDGKAPYGVWVPGSIDIDPEWARNRDPDHDVAFLRLRPATGDPRGEIEGVTGAEELRFGGPRRLPARVLGYPNAGERPVACQNATEAESATQQRFACEGLPNGTSGSPFLTDVDPATGLGTLVGVLGGKDEGGDEETSYSTYFGDAIERLYRRAVR
ncbi:trypsin-like peptidase domain-containing protein [Streptomyces sp. NPDC026206]|uniref:trypsin-like serine peptidase n=1 Tax=Streptomyces sp. NPDC026206 TaxID=3157089 RepID=UPI0033D59F42